ncbi:hypothetical protein [Hymenobacter arcticus]
MALLLLNSFSGSSQTSSAKPVCLSIPDAQRLLDSLRHLPAVRREALEWHLAYDKAHQAALQDSLAAQHYHADLLHSQAAFSGQQLLLNERQAEVQKFRARAHRKGWVLAALLAGIGLLGYLH